MKTKVLNTVIVSVVQTCLWPRNWQAKGLWVLRIQGEHKSCLFQSPKTFCRIKKRLFPQWEILTALKLLVGNCASTTPAQKSRGWRCRICSKLVLISLLLQGVFFTGSAQTVLSMELVPHNSKKTTKYTGSAQYIKNGKVSQRSSNHLFLRHYAGERFSQVSSLIW